MLGKRWMTRFAPDGGGGASGGKVGASGGKVGASAGAAGSSAGAGASSLPATGAAGDGQGAGQSDGVPPSPQTTPTGTWDDVLNTLPAEQRALYEQHTNGLRSALNSERERQREISRQLREATQAAEAGSAARQQLEQITTQFDETQRRADFYEEASRPEIGCANLKLAFMAAQSDGLIDDRGRVNWDALKQGYPELFRVNRQATPPGNAGAGTTTPPPRATSMDDLIRRRAGVVGGR